MMKRTAAALRQDACALKNRVEEEVDALRQLRQDLCASLSAQLFDGISEIITDLYAPSIQTLSKIMHSDLRGSRRFDDSNDTLRKFRDQLISNRDHVQEEINAIDGYREHGYDHAHALIEEKLAQNQQKGISLGEERKSLILTARESDLFDRLLKLGITSQEDLILAPSEPLSLMHRALVFLGHSSEKIRAHQAQLELAKLVETVKHMQEMHEIRPLAQIFVANMALKENERNVAVNNSQKIDLIQKQVFLEQHHSEAQQTDDALLDLLRREAVNRFFVRSSESAQQLDHTMFDSVMCIFSQLLTPHLCEDAAKLTIVDKMMRVSGKELVLAQKMAVSQALDDGKLEAAERRAQYRQTAHQELHKTWSIQVDVSRLGIVCQIERAAELFLLLGEPSEALFFQGFNNAVHARSLGRLSAAIALGVGGGKDDVEVVPPELRGEMEKLFPSSSLATTVPANRTSAYQV